MCLQTWKSFDVRLPKEDYDVEDNSTEKISHYLERKIL